MAVNLPVMAVLQLNKTKPRTTGHGYEASSPNQELSETMIKNNTSAVSLEQSLVTTSISNQNSLNLYRNKLQIIQKQPVNPLQVVFDRSGTTLSGFSDKSKANLRHVATNAFPELISQFGLTYHDEWPTDGKLCKAHLKLFLNYVRRILPNTLYLWLLEFQKRNAPHFHIFFTSPPEPLIWDKLAAKWSQITNGSDKQLWWHGSTRGENWIPWKMGNAQYLCKYIDKDKQKTIPPGYHNFGRFWGNSRDLVPEPETLAIEEMEKLSFTDKSTGEIYGGKTSIIRWLGRLAEKQTKGYSRFRKRAQNGSYSMQKGTPAFRQIETYFKQLNEEKL